MTSETPKQARSADAPQSSDDLGIGRRAADSSRLRLLNPDGSFNVERSGQSFFQSLHLYHAFVTMSWGRFLVLASVTYLGANVVFAAVYFLLGSGAVTGSGAVSALERFLDCFFFSVQTFSTIGYGGLSPSGIASNVVMTVESMAGMFFVALGAGLLFARFSRPHARILFSDSALIAPFQGGRAFMFRVANRRRSQLIDVEATVVVTLRKSGQRTRRAFYTLELERNRVMFLPLHWVVVHPITDGSPLAGLDEEGLRACETEFFILLSATDEASSQRVHARRSYTDDEVIWGARFRAIYASDPKGRVRIDLSAISAVEPAEVEAPPVRVS